MTNGMVENIPKFFIYSNKKEPNQIETTLTLYSKTNINYQKFLEEEKEAKKGNYKSKNNNNSLISISDFLIFLAFMPLNSTMTNLTQHNDEYQTFSIYYLEKQIFKIRYYYTKQQVAIKCTTKFNNMWYTKSIYGKNFFFLQPEVPYEIITGKNSKQTLWEFFKDKSNSKETHPFIKFGQTLHKKESNLVLNPFIEKQAYSESWKKKSNSITIELSEMDLKSFGGYFEIYISDLCNSTVKYGDSFLHSFIWLEPRIESVLSYASFIELDCSFFVLKPFVYCIPEAIIENESVPIGLSVGPSETSDIYQQFYNAIQKKFPESSIIIKKLPILSDEGKALKKFSIDNNLEQYFCYRHLIAKFGSNTQIAKLVRCLLYKNSKYEFDKFWENEKSNILEVLIQSNESQVRKFLKLFNVTGFDIKKKELGKHHFDQQSLWKRKEKHISTCSNHAESMHAKLNKSARCNRNIIKRFTIIFEAIEERFNSVSNRRNMKECIKKSYTNPDILSNEFNRSLFNDKLPFKENIKAFTVPDFPNFERADGCIIEIMHSINQQWKFPEVSEIEFPEEDDNFLQIQSFYGLPSKHILLDILPFLPFENIKCLKKWFLFWCSNVYGKITYDSEFIEHFKKFIICYFNGKKSEALEFFEEQKVKFYKTRKINFRKIIDIFNKGLFQNEEENYNFLIYDQGKDREIKTEDEYVAISDYSTNISTLIYVWYYIPFLRLSFLKNESIEYNSINITRIINDIYKNNKDSLSFRLDINFEDYQELSLNIISSQRDILSKNLNEVFGWVITNNVFHTQFNCIPLPANRYNTLSEALNDSTIERVNEFRKLHALPEISPIIITPPRVLQIDIKREIDGKVDYSKIAFDETLDLKECISTEIKGSAEYELYAVVIVLNYEIGFKGSFSAYIRPSMGEEWYYFSMSSREIENDKDRILGRKMLGKNVVHTLYYIRKDSFDELFNDPLKPLSKIAEDIYEKLDNEKTTQDKTYDYKPEKIITITVITNESLKKRGCGAKPNISMMYQTQIPVYYKNDPLHDIIMTSLNIDGPFDVYEVLTSGIIQKVFPTTTFIKDVTCYIKPILKGVRNEIVYFPVFLYTASINNPFSFLFFQHVRGNINDIFLEASKELGTKNIKAYSVRHNEHIKKIKSNGKEYRDAFEMIVFELENKDSTSNMKCTLSDTDIIKYDYFISYHKAFPQSYDDFFRVSNSLIPICIMDINDKTKTIYVPKGIEYDNFIGYIAQVLNINYDFKIDTLILYSSRSKKQIVFETLENECSNGIIIPYICKNIILNALKHTILVCIVFKKGGSSISRKKVILSEESTCNDLIVIGKKRKWVDNSSIITIKGENNIELDLNMKLVDIIDDIVFEISRI